MQELFQEIINNPTKSLVIIGNLIIIESLLSIDNAAVLATMVKDLPQNKREKALKYGIWGAYFFRGLAMLFAAYLIQVWWLKPLGGLYLLYLVFDFYKSKQTKNFEDDTIDKKSNWFYKISVGKIGNFWATVCLVEIMDIAFSIDNVFAAVAFSPNIILVCIGVFIGILGMRYIAQWFVKLMDRFHFLEYSAFLVIGILGLKLSVSIYEHYYPNDNLSKFLSSHNAELGLTFLTISIFIIPIISSLVFNFPKKNLD